MLKYFRIELVAKRQHKLASDGVRRKFVRSVVQDKIASCPYKLHVLFVVHG